MDVFNRFFKTHRELRLSVEAYAERMKPEDCAALGQPFVTIDLGLQSLNLKTLKTIRRPFKKDRFIRGVTNLHQTPARTNIYMICGLPFENSETYLQGINEVLQLNPNQIFLNDLVILNGTELRKQIDENNWGYKYNLNPPYDVAENRWIPKRAMSALNALSKAISNCYNNSRSPAILLHSWGSKHSLDTWKTCSVVFHQKKMYACDQAFIWHELSNSTNDLVSDAKILLQTKGVETKELF